MPDRVENHPTDRHGFCTVEGTRILRSDTPVLITKSPAVSEPPPRHSDVGNLTTPDRTVLWQLHGAIDDLVCTVVVTSYGYALSLELAGEPILLELQRSLEQLVCKANRLEAWLLTQGWQEPSAD